MICELFSSLKGSAVYQRANGYNSLYLNGATGTYAEVPAFDLTSEMTFVFWLKVNDPAAVSTILADWSFPWKFRVFLTHTSSTEAVFKIEIRNVWSEDMTKASYTVK